MASIGYRQAFGELAELEGLRSICTPFDDSTFLRTSRPRTESFAAKMENKRRDVFGGGNFEDDAEGEVDRGCDGGGDEDVADAAD